ncbi:unnamed protein product [marine sediment metagenome]|uniref:Uncharacterized protein n=1 Tax=marine sediment metagenome TaxID=412755 RepID=X1N8S2_9ZZZZ
MPVEFAAGTAPNDESQNELEPYQVVAEKAAAYIVAGYNSEPRQTPMQTAAILDAVLPLPEPLRPGLTEYKGVLGAIAKINYAAQVETSPEDVEGFVSYFGSVFDVFISTSSEKLKQVFMDAGAQEPSPENREQAEI